MNLGSFFGPLVVLCYFFLAAAASRKTEGKKEEWINFLQDPRQNESLYDLAVRKSTSYGEMIGSVSEILIKKGLINATTRINKYKLIYFSPQVISVEKKLSDTAQNNSSIQSGESPTGGSTFFGTTLNEPLFTVSSVNGSIHIFTPSNEPTLEYLCVKKSICSCFSCIFSLNVIYSLDFNRIKADTIRVFVDDFNDYAPEFYSVQSELVLNISEASRVGDRFRVENARAYDLDAFYNQVSYYLSDKEVVPQESNMDRSLLSGLFEIEQQDDESTNERDLILVLKAHLDYETKRRYVIYLVASDNGRTNINGVVVKDVLRASKKLVVNVVDENDNTPVCEKSMFIESVKENRIERDFLQIRAVDPDSGLNSKLKFTIERATSKNRNPTSSSSDQTDNDEDLFDINRDTGWLSLRKTLDYEKKSSYDLVVRVSDSGLKTSFSIRCLARINVLDMNDNQAQIKVIKYLNESMGRGYYSFSVQAEDEVASDTQLSSSEYMDVDLGTSSIRNQIELYENNSPNVVLALIRVFDRDSLSNYKFIIQSVTNNFHEETSMFEIRPVADSNGTKSSNREYELVASGVFNAELIQNYKLRITLYDLDDDVYYHQSLESLDEKVMSGDAASSEFNFCVSLVQRVHVLDLNDNKPEFSRKYYEFRLRENEENVTLTTGHQIEVYDLDSSERNSNITFKMSDKLGQLNASDYFELSTNKNYPNLVAKKSFDYETDGSQFEFYLSAYDVDNLTDTALIKIRIDDVNDNPPMFINDNSTFYIKENTPVNSFIGQVIALDKDSPGPNSDVSFRIVSEHLRSLFKVYKTGVLSNWIEFDREVQSFYSIHIEAYDNGQPNSLTTMGTFYIRVEDENDCAPYFYYPKESTKFMNIKFPSLNQSNFTVNNTTQRLKLLNVKAFDDDLEDNGKIVYYLSDSRPSFLSIDRQNGTLYFDYTNMTFSQFILFKSVVNVSIWASDCGTPSLNSSINLTLFLNYDSDELPDYLFNNRAHKSPNDINNHKFNTLLDSLGHKTTLDKIDTETHSRAYDHVIQILLNNFLLIFLVAILCLIIFITCFVFVTIYKRSFSASLSCCNIEKSRRSGTKNLRLLTSHIQDFLNNRGNVRTKTTSVFKNLSSSNVSQHDNLTVKDANSTDRESSLDSVDQPQLISNTFRVRIKSLDIKGGNQPTTNTTTTTLNTPENLMFNGSSNSKLYDTCLLNHTHDTICKSQSPILTGCIANNNEYYESTDVIVFGNESRKNNRLIVIDENNSTDEENNDATKVIKNDNNLIFIPSKRPSKVSNHSTMSRRSDFVNTYEPSGSIFEGGGGGDSTENDLSGGLRQSFRCKILTAPYYQSQRNNYASPNVVVNSRGDELVLDETSTLRKVLNSQQEKKNASQASTSNQFKDSNEMLKNLISKFENLYHNGESDTRRVATSSQVGFQNKPDFC